MRKLDKKSNVIPFQKRGGKIHFKPIEDIIKEDREKRQHIMSELMEKATKVLKNEGEQ